MHGGGQSINQVQLKSFASMMSWRVSALDTVLLRKYYYCNIFSHNTACKNIHKSIQYIFKSIKVKILHDFNN